MTERERRAFNRGLETAAKLARLYADENEAMCFDTFLADRILTGEATQQTIKVDLEKSADLLIDGHGHAMVFHACNHLAEMIRGHKVSKA